MELKNITLLMPNKAVKKIAEQNLKALTTSHSEKLWANCADYTEFMPDALDKGYKKAR